jgi:hypothetical protein
MKVLFAARVAVSATEFLPKGNDMDEKTITEIYMKAGFAQTRGYGAAMSRGWRDCNQPEAFMDGARWMLEQIQEHCTITPKADAGQLAAWVAQTK